MAGRDPAEIWEESTQEGKRRLERGAGNHAATGFVGGVDIMLGVAALTVVSGALAISVPEQIAHVGGSLAFGIGIVLLVVGRSELFTENFLVPFAGALRSRHGTGSLLRLWGVTLLSNAAGLLLLAAIMTRAGLVPPEALDAAGKLADTYAERDVVGALLSGLVAGTVMTLLTWVALAVETDIARILLALLVGFLLAAPSLNHAVVSLGEMAFGVFAGTAKSAEWTDIAQNLPLAIVGNLVGGVGFVTLMRLVQARGEPGAA